VPVTVKKAPRAPRRLIPTNRPPARPLVTAADLGRKAPTVRLLDKVAIRALTGVTFPTIWTWMQAGAFPRSRIVGGKSMWLSTEVDAWMAALPVRPLKGDAPSPEAARGG
jgi:predicted DNA-binding transcriptional regulator AlpA